MAAHPYTIPTKFSIPDSGLSLFMPSASRTLKIEVRTIKIDETIKVCSFSV